MQRKKCIIFDPVNPKKETPKIYPQVTLERCFETLIGAAKLGIYPHKQDVYEFANCLNLQIKEIDNHRKNPLKTLQQNPKKPSFLARNFFGISTTSDQKILEKNKKSTAAAMQSLKKIIESKSLKLNADSEKILFEAWGYQVRRRKPSQDFLDKRQGSLMQTANKAFDDDGTEVRLSEEERQSLTEKIEKIIADCLDPQIQWKPLKDVFQQQGISLKDKNAGNIIKELLKRDLQNFDPQKIVVKEIKQELVPITLKVMMLREFPGRIGGGDFALLGDLELRKEIAQTLLSVANQYNELTWLIEKNHSKNEEKNHPCFEYLFDAIKAIDWTREDFDNYCFDFNFSSNEQARGIKKILQIIIEETESLRAFSTKEVREKVDNLT